MRKLFIAIGCAASIFIPMTAAEPTGPILESCTVGDRPFTRPLDYIGFFFDEPIRLLDGARAVVRCDGRDVATSTRMEVSNYVSGEYRQGKLSILFDGRLLPKGKDYTVYVEPSSIADEADGTANKGFSQDFTVPENLGPGHTDDEDGKVIEKASGFEGLQTFYWGIETEPAGNPVFLLYREGVLVREIPAYVTWDWDLGQAHPKIEEEIRFEKGVRYSQVFPAGSAHSMYRDDIVNEEFVFNFIGGYEEPIPPLRFIWCSQYDERADVLDVVTFTYDRPVRVTEGAKAQLWANDECVVVEAELHADAPADCRTVSADFGGYRLQPMVGYSFVIPEGAVVAESGDPVVNDLCNIPLADPSGMKRIGLNDMDNSNGIIYDMDGRKVVNPSQDHIYIKKGRKFIHR